MCKGKKFLSVLLAAFICMSTVNITALPAYAAESSSTEVGYNCFDTSNDNDVQEKLEAKLRSVLRLSSKRELGDVTYGELEKVTSLDLSGLELTDLPKCIEYMTNLTTLNLSNNMLQSDALRALDLSNCTKLKSVNLSSNYIDSVPRWAITEKITTRNLSNNFIKNENPRTIRVDDTVLTHYFMEEDEIDLEEFKKRILDTVTFTNKVSSKYVELPDFLYYDSNDLANSKLFLDTSELQKYINADSKIELPSGNKTSLILTLTVTLCNCSEAEVRVYLLNGSDITTLNVQLSSLINEYDTLSKSKSNYTDSSWSKYENAYTMAKAISNYTKEYEDLTMLRNAFDALNRARRALVESISGNKLIGDTLKELEKVGKTYKEADYTPASWATFKAALDRISELAKNSKDAGESEAHTAIKRFLSAQAGLTATTLSVPAAAPKSDFEQIYGEDMNKTYSGTMLDGKKYAWTFRGKDITNPVDFKPEVQDTHSSSSDIMMETGSAGGFRLFSTVQTGAFPGKATLELEIDSLANGSYYLYKWDTSSKRGKMLGSVTVTDNKLTASVEEGGLYYISSVVRNFDLKSTRFKIDTANKRLVIPLLGNYSVSQLKNSMEFGSYVEVSDENGDSVSNVSMLYNDMTINAPGGDKYTVKTSGDINNDGKYSLADVTALLEVVVKNTDSYYADVNGDGSVGLKDVTDLLGYYINMA